MRSRRGFSLVELLVVMLLLVVVSGTALHLLVGTQRISRAQADRTDLQATLRSGMLVVPAELRMIGYDSVVRPTVQGGVAYAAGAVIPDILGMGPDSIVIRAVRAVGIVCDVGTDRVVVDTTRYYSAYRVPTAGRDSLLLYFEIDPSTAQDDAWFSRPITSVLSGACSPAYGSRAGLTLGTAELGHTGVNPPDSLVAGAPFRTFEVVSYKLTESGGRHWLSAKSVSGHEAGYQPILGPLTAGGFRLDYFDSTGSGVATAPRDVRIVQVTLIGESDRAVTGTGYGSQTQVVDSVVTRVALRNALR